jgi:hypothetical protein
MWFLHASIFSTTEPTGENIDLIGEQQNAFLSKLSEEQFLLGNLKPGESVSFSTKPTKGGRASFAAAGKLNRCFSRCFQNGALFVSMLLKLSVTSNLPAEFGQTCCMTTCSDTLSTGGTSLEALSMNFPVPHFFTCSRLD